MDSEHHTSGAPAPSAPRIAALRILLGGIFGMMVAMGIGRFAYTPILPVMERELGMTHAVAGWLAAVSFGGTFLGIVTLVMTEGNRRAGHDERRTAAVLTVCFSVGQVIGPPLAGRMADLQGGFAMPLLLAALAVASGGILVALDTGGFRRRTT